MKIRRRRRMLFALAPLFLLLIVGEAAARLKLYFRHGQVYYLFMPLYSGARAPDAPVERKLHVAGQGERKSNTFYYKMDPGIYEAPAPNTTTYRINSLGFRGAEFAQVKAPGVTRIFCVGQSSTFGMESGDSDTWPARLGHYLAARKPGAYEVINAGFDGYYSYHMRNLVLGELGRYQPDMLIIYAGLNDVNFETGLEEKRASAVARAVHGLLYYRWSMLYTLASEKVAVMRQGNPAAGLGYVDRTNERFVENMTAILRWCRSEQVRCVAVREAVHAVPSVYLRDSLSLQEAQESLGSGARDRWGASYAPALTLTRYMSLAATYKTLAAAHGVPFLDLRPAMAEAIEHGTKVMHDYGHLTPAGNDILAREMAKHIN